jgi:hypothetical protein
VKPWKARIVIKAGYGETREMAEHSCFGDCCLSDAEKRALLDLIYEEE